MVTVTVSFRVYNDNHIIGFHMPSAAFLVIIRGMTLFSIRSLMIYLHFALFIVYEGCLHFLEYALFAYQCSLSVTRHTFKSQRALYNYF